MPLLLIEVVRITLMWEVAISPRYTREPLTPSLHILEVSHVSISKSSITLRYFNYVRVSYETRCNDSENLEELKPFSEKTYENLA